MTYFDNDYTENDWRIGEDCRERDENAREARDQADWYRASDSPAVTAFLNETTPDAPGGAYESQMEMDRRHVTPSAERISFGMELSTTQLLASMRSKIRRTRKVA